MQLAHMAIRTPGACGLYETTRELANGLRSLGEDSRIVDPAPNPRFAPEPKYDRGVPIADMDWACQSDIVISHSGHDGTPVADIEQPIIHVAHGRPTSTWLLEHRGNTPAYSYAINRRAQERYKACVTFWPEYEPMLRELWAGTQVYVVPPAVDLDYWQPEKADVPDYDFGGQAGAVNVVMTDPWSRQDSHPILMAHAFALFRRIVPDAKLHIFAVDSPKGFGALRGMLGESLGIVQGWGKDLRSVYAKADLLITPHRIYTRSIREAMAMGVQVVSGRDVHPEDTEAFAMQMAERLERPEQNRELAEVLFHPTKTAKAFRKVARAVRGD
jgi:glycosyltransferase involved in cell wall biosynthesis